MTVSLDSDTAIMTTYAPAAVTFVRGAGTELFDDEGRRYLDFLSGLAVTSLGHAHPKVAAAVATQAATLVHVSNIFGNLLAPDLARTIDKLIGDGSPPGGQVFFCNSGAEANECAIKLVRRARPGRPGLVSAIGGFHGRTLASLAATGQSEKQAAFLPMPMGFSHVAYGDLEALVKATAAPDVGAVILESIQGEGGVVPAPAGYLESVRRLCDARELLLILDEVQTGFARTGRWFGFQRADILPDIVTMAKALGNGFPIGACWARTETAQAFKPGDHGSTFGGQPVAVAAAQATLDVMQEIDAPSLAESCGRRLSQALLALPGVESVRGAGLMVGAVLHEILDAKLVVAAALKAGLVVNAPVPGILRLTPPLTVSAEEIDQAVRILHQVLSGLVGSVAAVQPVAAGGPVGANPAAEATA